MDKLNENNNNDKKKVEVLSLGNYKEKVEEKTRKIKEFNEGPQPLEGCTCGQHTDINELLTEDLITEHYLKDRKRYVEGLEGEDPMEIYMESVKSMTGNVPSIRISPSTDAASTKYRQEHFSRAMSFYQQYIKGDQELTYEGKLIAEQLKAGYKEYKKHLVLRIRGMYLLQKLDFIKENSSFVGKHISNFSEREILESNIGNTEGYIEYINECFSKSEQDTSKSATVITAESINMIVNKKINGVIISKYEVQALGTQIEISLKVIADMTLYHRQLAYENIKKEYDQVKDDCTIEYKAELLIDLELISRHIDECYDYDDNSGFTVNNDMDQLIETIGMEAAIGKLRTKELETLLEQFKALEA